MSKAEGYLRPYRGKVDDFQTFWAKFDVLATINKWDSDEKKMAQLPLFLEQDAFLVFSRMKSDDKKKPDAVQKKMEEAFCMTKSEAYRRFKARRMRQEESPDAYVADLQRLASLAGDASPGDDKNHSVVEQFLDGLPHAWAKQVRLSLVGKDQTVSACLELVRAVQLSDGDSVTAAVGTGAGTGSLAGGARGDKTSRKSFLCYLCNEVGHMKRDCPRRKQGQQSGSSSKDGGGRGSTCYFCDRPGHRKPDCPDRKAWLASRQGGSAAAAAGEEPSPALASVSVPSPGQLPRIKVDMWTTGNKDDVSRMTAVIDTGAVRSLLTKDQALSCGLAWSECESRLVALDGQSIAVLGKVAVNIGRLDGPIPVQMPEASVELLVVNDLSVVHADLLIGCDVASSCGGLHLEYANDGRLESVRFGPVSSPVSAALPQDGHPSRHVQVSRHGQGVTLSARDGEVQWCHETKRWILRWKWKSGAAPEVPVGSGIGQYSREKLSPEQEKLFCKEVDAWIANGWLVPHDEATHGAVAGVLPLIARTQEHKASTPIRPCLDYRKLNELIESEPGYEAPVCAEKIRQWRRSSDGQWEMLDVKKAYLQVHVSAELVRYQAVLWNNKVYVMTRMGFGLAIAPKFMHLVIQWITRHRPEVDNYVDDIRAPAEVTQCVADELAAYGLPTKPAEPMEESRVLGMQLKANADGAMGWSRREIDLEPPPKMTRRKVFSWCGRLIGHYPVCSWLRPACSYLKRLATAAGGNGWDDPLPETLVECCQELFARLSSDDPVHGQWDVHAQADSTWTAWCDASGLAIGVVLELDGTVVEDASWLRPAGDKLHVNVAELDSAIKALTLATRWNATHVVLKTDSKTTAGWLAPVVGGSRRVRVGGLHEVLVQRRLQIVNDLLSMTKMQVTVEWVPTTENLADKLTRVPFNWPKKSSDVVASLPRAVAVSPVSSNELGKAQASDEVIQGVIQQIQVGQPVASRRFRSCAGQLHVEEGRLVRSLKLPVEGEVNVPVVPELLVPDVVTAAHVNTGHASWQPMYELLRKHCYFPEMASACQDHVKGCQNCQAASPAKGPAAPSARAEIPGRPWGTVQMDTLELGLNRGGTHHCVLVCVDVLTKWVEIVPMKRHDGPSVASAFVSLCCRWGPPDVIRVDNGTEFSNAIVQSVFQVFGVRVKTGAVRHPQSQGAAERYNRTLLTLIRKVLDESSDWMDDLQMLVHFYRSRPHSVTGMSPMMAMVGWDPPVLIDDGRPRYDFDTWQAEHAARSARIRDLLEDAMSEGDCHDEVLPCAYQAGDAVMLRMPSRRQKRLPPFESG
ncbi:uncharacterized protein LOC135816500 [Sycon ciliatum]|uniref:uncharacterized protein LOC135816500 n=1 Tax=Sycon ciliatum TaxID=27933 RepID=UPI0031F66EA5